MRLTNILDSLDVDFRHPKGISYNEGNHNSYCSRDHKKKARLITDKFHTKSSSISVRSNNNIK